MKSTGKKIEIFITVAFAFFMIAIVTVRAAITGMTYDEAYTYIYYVYPLFSDFTLKHLKEISDTCLANNHWLNTLSIVLLTKLTGVVYQEFLIRLPVLIFGWVYYLYAAYCKIKDRITWPEFVLLIGSYYANEFFGLARGYGMCTSLVLLALMTYKKYEKDHELKYFWISLFILTIACYANSSCLLIIGALGLAFLLYQIRYRKNNTFVKINFIILPIWLISISYIVLYHFRVTDVEKGMPVYAADSNVNLIFYIRQYIFLTFHTEASWLCIIISIVAAGSILVLIIKRKIFEKEIGVAFIIYFAILLLTVIVFKRGGLVYRTLLPSYPLFILGMGELVKGCLENFDGFFDKVKKYQVVLGAALLAIALINGKSAFNLQGTADWDENYEIKWKDYSGFELEGDCIEQFYHDQKNSQICRIYGIEFEPANW